MARAKQEQKKDDGRSMLRAAFNAYDRGDAVQARSLAQAVLAGKVGPDDEKAAADLAKRLTGEGAAVGETVQAVASELVTRTEVPSKAYLVVGAIAATFVALTVLAHYRY